MEEYNAIRCRNCGNTNLKIYEDGSGFCQDCHDAFPDVNNYVLRPKKDQEENIPQQNQMGEIGRVHVSSNKQNNRFIIPGITFQNKLLNTKLILGLFFYTLSMIAFLFIVFVPSTVCLAAILGLLFFVIGLVFMFIAGVESIQEYRKGNRSLSVKVTLLLLIMFFLPVLISLLFPIFYDKYSEYIGRLSFIGIILGFFYFFYLQKPKE